MHTHGERAVVEALGDGEQLHDVAEPRGGGDVVGGDLADALVVHVAGDHPDTERDRRDDRRLRACVVPLDVGGGIALGIPEALRLGERVAVARTSVGHPSEDEVRRAVDDPHDAADRLAGERLAQRPHQRDAAGDRCLEQEVASRGVGRAEDLGTDVREQLLVRGDNRLAVLECREDQLARRLDAADDLDDEVDRRILDDFRGVAGEQALGDRHGALTRQVAHGDTCDLEAQARASLDGSRALFDEPDERAADVATTEDADADGLAHACSRYRAGAAIGPGAFGLLSADDPEDARSVRENAR